MGKKFRQIHVITLNISLNIYSELRNICSELRNIYSELRNTSSRSKKKW